MPQACLLLCTCPDTESAGRIARALVQERLAACVSRVPGLTSTYRWQNEIKEDGEILLLIKSTAAAFGMLCARVQDLHPYEVPELVMLDIKDGLPDYLAWLRDQMAVSEADPTRS